MVSIEHAIRMLDRAYKGPTCTSKEWGFKLPKTIAEKMKKYRLEKTFDAENPVNTDDELADRFFKAGFELALEMGSFCMNTERVIEVTEGELDDAIRNAPSELALGKGADMVVLKARKPEDKLKPLSASALGHLVTEDVYLRLIQGIAQQREIDIFRSCMLATIFGSPVLAGSPYETAVGMYQAKLSKEARWRAGRPGMCDLGPSASVTAFGQLGGFGVIGGFDPEVDCILMLAPGELTTSFDVLHKVVHAANCGAKTNDGASSVIGGYSGGPEGSAMTRIASVIHQFAIYQADSWGASVVDARYMGNCGREGIWSDTIAYQALSRNTHFLGLPTEDQVAGPCTEMLLYESAVAMINLSASGSAGYLGPRTSGTKYANHITPLECKFCAEVLKASAGMTRKKANEIVKVLIPKYEGDLYNPPKGKSFQECFDLETLEPTQEYLDIYLKVKKELIELGVPLA